MNNLHLSLRLQIVKRFNNLLYLDQFIVDAAKILSIQNVLALES